MNKSQLVKILVPIYRSDLNKFERISLERNDPKIRKQSQWQSQLQ